MLVLVVFNLVLSCGVIVVSPCCWRWRNNLNEPLDSAFSASEVTTIWRYTNVYIIIIIIRSLSLFGWLLSKKAARVEVNISLAFLHWVGIADVSSLI